MEDQELEANGVEDEESEGGPSDHQQELAREGAEAADMRYRQNLQDAGRGHLLPP